MKHLIRDYLILFFSVSGIAWLYRVRQHGPLVRVVCFHDIPDPQWFKSVISILHKNYHVVSPDQFHANDFHPEKINILITFDDGYQSWVDVAIPVLKKYDFQALFFITSGLLDAADEDGEAVTHFVRDRLRLTTPRRTLTWDGAKEIVAAGHTIGGHTVTHVSLSELDEVNIVREVVQDKKQLETVFKTQIVDFAYPFGQKQNMCLVADKVIRRQGYSNVFSAETGFCAKKSVINRTLIEEGENPIKIKRKICGAYDIVRFLIFKLCRHYNF